MQGGEAPASPPSSSARDDLTEFLPLGWFRILDIVISSRERYVWAERGSPLPKNYLNFQLCRRAGSRLLR
jgi:hypothetical protein